MNINKKNRRLQTGFTIIELMVSTLIFTLVLMAVTAGMVQISRMYYRGISNARTQGVTRSVVEDIGQSMQFSNQVVTPPNYPVGTVPGPEIPANQKGNGVDTFVLCVGTRRYSFAVDRKRTLDPTMDSDHKESKHVLWVDEPASGCAESAVVVEPVDLSQDVPSLNGKELLDENMRINRFELIENDGGLWTINLSLAYGDDDLLIVADDGRRVCEGNTIGVEFCAVSDFSTNIFKRVQ